MSKWSQEAWEATKPVFAQIVQHPFLKQLTDGNLDREKFTFYIQQDSLYLAEFGRVLAGIAVKAPVSDHVAAFLSFAGDTMTVEKGMHATFLAGLDMANFKLSPSALLYTSYMVRQLQMAPLEVVVATVLPCFWIYKEVGDYILAQTRDIPQDDNPYKAWIDTYGGEEYAQAVNLAIEIADEMANATTAAIRQEMTEAFVTCSKLEWMFWDCAWHLEKWPV